jgi:hypothetical protein
MQVFHGLDETSVPKNYTGGVTFFDWYAFKFYPHGTVSLSLCGDPANTRVSQVLHHGKPDTGPAWRLSAIDRTYEGARMLGRRTSVSDLINSIDIDREHGNISRRPYG